MKRIEKKIKEREIATYFADYLNKINDCNYKAISNMEEFIKDTDVDVYLVDENNDFKNNLQIATQDGDILEAFGKKQNKSFLNQRVNRIALIIDKKSKKIADKKNLVLLIYSEFGNDIDSSYLIKSLKEHELYKENWKDWKDIYFLKITSFENRMPKNRQIINISFKSNA